MFYGIGLRTFDKHWYGLLRRVWADQIYHKGVKEVIFVKILGKTLKDIHGIVMGVQRAVLSANNDRYIDGILQ